MQPERLSLKRGFIAFLSLLLFASVTQAQYLPVHRGEKEVYLFLEEMYAQGLIDINTAIKPYSQQFIAQKLIGLQKIESSLNRRQLADLRFFLRQYAPEALQEGPSDGTPEATLLGFGFKPKIAWAQPKNRRWDMLFYQDSLFTIRINPVYGQQYWVRDDGETNNWRYNGAEAEATVGKHWAFYGNLRDNNQEQWQWEPQFFTEWVGIPHKPKGSSESRGGITYSWNWGNVGFVKDHFEWGTNRHGANIFSGRTASFPHFRMNLYPAKWFEFNFIHGQLVSDVLDSTRSYYTTGGNYRSVMRDKYVSANLFTAKPTRWFQFSLGNSVIYSDRDHWAYWIPFAFYKSIDHTLNSMYKLGSAGQNSQMFADVSVRPVKHLQLYGTLFIDELQLARITDPLRHNFESYKGGFVLSGFPFRNIELTGEYTLTSPMTYTHNIATTTFETNSYNLGHYLIDNSEEYYVLLRYKPVRQLRMEVSYTLARHGTDTDYSNEEPADTHDWLNIISWQQETFSFRTSWQPVHAGRLTLEIYHQNTTGNVTEHSPEFTWGSHWYVSLGAGFGL